MNELANIKAGDAVAWYGGFGSGGPSIEKVERVTNERVIVRGMKYRKSSGSRCGDNGAYYSSIAILTEEIRQQIAATAERQAAYNAVKDVRLNTLTTTQLRRIKAILEEPS